MGENICCLTLFTVSKTIEKIIYFLHTHRMRDEKNLVVK
jgi:hypothetical protein